MSEHIPASAERRQAPVREITPPPHHLDTEAALLSALLNGEAIPADLSPLTGEHFYSTAHRRIFEVITSLCADGVPVSVLVVVGRLREAGRLEDVGGVPALARIVDEIPSPASLPEAVRQVVDAWARREAGAKATKLAAACRRLGPDTGELLREAADWFRSLDERRGTAEAPTDLLSGYSADMARAQDAANAPCATVTTGWARVDEAMCGGWWAQKTVVIGARPGTGKTATGIKAALTCASTAPEDGGGGALFISAELPADEMRQRILSHEAGISAAQARTPSETTVATMVQWVPYLATLPVWVDDRARTITAVRASVRRHVRLAAQRTVGGRPAPVPLRMVVIDYIQRVRAEGKFASRNEELAEVCRQIGEMRAEHPGLSLIVLAQLNRESSDGRKPRDSDLRECGQLEQDADTIALLWRPEKSDPDVVEMVFAKNRGLRQDIAPRFRVDPALGRLVEEVTP